MVLKSRFLRALNWGSLRFPSGRQVLPLQAPRRGAEICSRRFAPRPAPCTPPSAGRRACEADLRARHPSGSRIAQHQEPPQALGRQRQTFKVGGRGWQSLQRPVGRASGGSAWGSLVETAALAPCRCSAASKKMLFILSAQGLGVSPGRWVWTPERQFLGTRAACRCPREPPSARHPQSRHTLTPQGSGSGLRCSHTHSRAPTRLLPGRRLH